MQCLSSTKKNEKIKNIYQNYLRNCIYYKREQITFKMSSLSKKLLLILIFLSTSLFKGFLENCIYLKREQIITWKMSSFPNHFF